MYLLVAEFKGGEAMRPRILMGAAVAAAVAFVIFCFGMQVAGQSRYRAGWWGPGMMGGYAMGPGMMGGYGYGMGPWMMTPYRNNPATLNLSVDDVKNSFGRWLAWQGNPRVKLGNVSEKDTDTIAADIVTTDKDGLVQRFAVDRHTGFTQPSED